MAAIDSLPYYDTDLDKIEGAFLTYKKEKLTPEPSQVEIRFGLHRLARTTGRSRRS